MVPGPPLDTESDQFCIKCREHFTENTVFNTRLVRFVGTKPEDIKGQLYRVYSLEKNLYK